MLRRSRFTLALASLAALAACNFDWPPSPPKVSPIPAYAGPDTPLRRASAPVTDEPLPTTAPPPPPPAPPVLPGRSAELFDRFLDQRLQDNPSLGRSLGLHEFDGKVAACSREAIEARIARVEKARADLAAIDKASLDEAGALDLALLIRDAELFLFRHKDLAEWRSRPQYYEELFDVSGYLERDYAPIEERGQRLLAHERAALAEAPHIRENLMSPMSLPVLKTAVKVFQGYAEYLRGDVVKQLKGVGSAEFQAAFKATNEQLAAEADKIAAHLKNIEVPKGDDSHVLGVERYRKLLLVQEGITLSLADLKKMGEDNLAQNKRDYEALAEKAKFTRPTADAVLGEASRITAAARQFLADKRLVTIPTEDRAVPKETPPFMRWNAAFLNGPGPFEAKATTAFYYITRPDPSLPKREQEEYLMPLGVLLSTTVHETYPGHFLHDQWIKRAPTRAQKMLSATSFVEGWAHYGEQMMIEEGFGAEDPQNHLGQLSDALLRNCRFVVSIGMHTEHMTLAKAEKRFIEDCHQDKATAREQAARGTFDPGYFVYTLGKLQILSLRNAAKKQLGDKFSLRRFHDALLAHGAPPVPLIGERVLRDLVDAAK